MAPKILNHDLDTRPHPGSRCTSGLPEPISVVSLVPRSEVTLVNPSVRTSIMFFSSWEPVRVSPDCVRPLATLKKMLWDDDNLNCRKSNRLDHERESLLFLPCVWDGK